MRNKIASKIVSETSEKTKILTKGTGLPNVFRTGTKEFETALLAESEIR